MALGNSVPGQEDSVAMEVDRVEKGKKGKGKGKQSSWKGKGKGDSKGKGKDSFQSGKGKSADGKGRPTQWTYNQNPWNKGWTKGKQLMKGDAKGGKPSPKGKGKAACFNCGSTGHFARDCKVRNVSEQNQGDDADRSASSATSYNNSANQQTQQVSSDKQIGRVNRVAFDMTAAQDSTLVFDVTSFDDFSNLRVAMVSEDVQPVSCSCNSEDVQSMSFECSSEDVQLISCACSSEDVQQVPENVQLNEPSTDVLCLQGLSDVDMPCSGLTVEQKLQDVDSEMQWVVKDLQTHVQEFSVAKNLNSACESFELCKLFQLDDNKHFLEVAKRGYGLELYETAEFSRSCAWKRFGDNSYFKPLNLRNPIQIKHTNPNLLTTHLETWFLTVLRTNAIFSATFVQFQKIVKLFWTLGQMLR